MQEVKGKYAYFTRVMAQSAISIHICESAVSNLKHLLLSILATCALNTSSIEKHGAYIYILRTNIEK